MAKYHILGKFTDQGIKNVKETVKRSERKFEDSFPDCDVGAMSPFGNLYGLEVYAAGSLAKNEEIVFNAGTHSEIIRLAYKDFANLAKPKVANFSYFASV